MTNTGIETENDTLPSSSKTTWSPFELRQVSSKGAKNVIFKLNYQSQSVVIKAELGEFLQ